MKIPRLGLVTSLLLASCGNGASEAGGSGDGGAGTGGASAGSDIPGGLPPPGEAQHGEAQPGTGGDGSSDGDPSVCAAENTEAELRPVYLAFAFDVSGSMGKGDLEHHDRELKWDPVVAATKAFFADPASVSISASLSFFPAASDRCDAESYATPDVPMTPLPSDAFAVAIDDITPETEDDWRGGTPTLAVVDGTLSFLEPMVEADPSSIYALVLVTDGYPQDCDDDDIETVADAVAAVSDAIPTYVIGVENPPGGPDTVSDLHAIAVAGGTEEAFLIETGDPAQTKRDFEAVIENIRGRSVSCDVAIPPPPAGQVFDPKKVNVTYEISGDDRAFAYDQSCEHPDSWRYDDPDSPTVIELCPETCALAQGETTAKLLVEFGCESRAPVVR